MQSLTRSLLLGFVILFGMTINVAAAADNSPTDEELVLAEEYLADGQLPTNEDLAMIQAYLIRLADEDPTGLLWSLLKPTPQQTLAPAAPDTLGAPVQIPLSPYVSNNPVLPG